ncbi:ABC transporter permease [Pseudooceanicola nanhaiensis]|uniref:ABC transporter permease n=1 Tax=Pseudooceanicola nanhaiensis TaxID=375761 RepID=UPI001CD5BE38|nr:ABC transporter permease [Pseudooceanicola nanhaiensis]MCA0921593.1 ABC transporter permease [Pseudooceanicola nanhaiensis]
MSNFWTTFKGNKGAVVGLVILAIVLLASIFAPMLYTTSPWDMVNMPFMAPGVDSSVPLGTDTLGRDIAAGLAHGAYISLLVGFVSTIVSLCIGIPLGAAAGYFGGWVDDVLMRITEFFQVIPSFAFAIVLVAIFEPSITSMIVAIAVVSWPPVARLLRGEVMSLKHREFIEAAELSGQSGFTIITRQILPNTISPVIVLASMMVATAILTESALSFMGLGDPNVMSWGYIIGAGRTVLQQAWWISFFPGVAILLTVLAFNLIGEGLNDALNPRLAKRRG